MTPFPPHIDGSPEGGGEGDAETDLGMVLLHL
jgi:hypothetical protein